MVTYTAASLEDVAKMFDRLAENCDKQSEYATNRLQKSMGRMAATTWRDAARTLRETRLLGGFAETNKAAALVAERVRDACYQQRDEAGAKAAEQVRARIEGEQS